MCTHINVVCWRCSVGELCRKKRNVERMGGGGGWEMRYEKVGGIWVEMEICLSCFPLLSCVSISRPLDQYLGAFPERAPNGTSPVPPSALEERFSMPSLPPGQWVCSGSSEWALLQFHYSRNWLQWKQFLTSRRAPATTLKARGKRRRNRREGEMNPDMKWDGRHSDMTFGETSGGINSRCFLHRAEGK